MSELSDLEWQEIQNAIARLRGSVMAVAFGLSGGVGLFVATAWLLIKGGPMVGKNLSLLSNYFPGYTVTWPGTVVGFLYGALTGAILGWSIAWLYNKLVDLRS